MVKKMTEKKNKRLLKMIGVFFIAAAAFGLILTWYSVYSTRSQSYKESEKFVDLIAALSLNIKDPNSLTSQDFEKVEEIRLRIYHLTTLKPLNLRGSYISDDEIEAIQKLLPELKIVR